MFNLETNNIIADAYLQVIKNIMKPTKVILESKADTNIKIKPKKKVKIIEANIMPDKDSSLNLINACSNGDLNSLDTLLKDGANINMVEKTTQKTPLAAAITYNQMEVVKVLIYKGVDLYSLDENNVSPLMLACNLGNFDIISLLLVQNNINVNIQEHYTGYNALMIILDSNILQAFEKERLIMMLIEKGADLNVKDEQYGLTALDRINDDQLINIRKILISNGALTSEELDKEG